MRRNPHPVYHRLRSEQPIAYNADLDDWLLTRWADCIAVLRDPRWSSNPETRGERRFDGPQVQDFGDIGVHTLLFLDPPDHTRLRRLVSKAFTPRRIEQLRDHVQEITDELLAGVDAGQPFDVISTLAYPLPVIVICELMGVPVEDRHLFEGWSSDATRLLDGDIDDDTMQRGIVAAMYFINYFNTLFEARRAEPRTTSSVVCIAVEESGDVLSEEELRSIVLLLFLAGHETTMNLIGNGLFALMQHRDEWDRLVADPSLAPSAVEELLRYDGPVHVTGRIASEDLEVGGQRFPKGSQVTTLLAAANRDPDRFPDPDRLDIGRADNQHLTFSHGIHYCLGAALARLEGQVVFEIARDSVPDVAAGGRCRRHRVPRPFRAARPESTSGRLLARQYPRRDVAPVRHRTWRGPRARASRAGQGVDVRLWADGLRPAPSRPRAHVAGVRRACAATSNGPGSTCSTSRTSPMSTTTSSTAPTVRPSTGPRSRRTGRRSGGRRWTPSASSVPTSIRTRARSSTAWSS